MTPRDGLTTRIDQRRSLPALSVRWQATSSGRSTGRMAALPLHASKTSSSPLDQFLAVCLILGAYTTLSIFSGDKIVVPSVISLGCAIIILMRHLRSIDRVVIQLFALVVFLSLLQTALLAFFGVIDMLPTLLPIANFACSLLTGYALFLSLRRIGGRRTKQLLCYFWVLLMTGAWAEVYLGLDIVSDAFRQTFFPRYMYDAELRDILLFGGVRPKVFSPEPSYVGVWFLATLAAWLAVPGKRSVWIEAPFAAAAILLIAIPLRSGTLIFAIPLMACAIIHRNSLANASHTFRNPGLIAVVAGVLALTSILGSLDLRWAPMFIQGDSFYARMIAPAKVALSTFFNYPLLGVGISNDVKMVELIAPIYQHRDLYMMSLGTITNADWLLTNSFYYHWIYFGVFLGSFIGIVYYKIFDRITNGCGLFVLSITSIIWFTVGGYTNIQSWTIAFLFAAASATKQAAIPMTRGPLTPRERRSTIEKQI